MKEMMRSKMMILFIAMVLGVTYASSLNTEKLEDENLEEYRAAIAINIK